MINNKQRTDFLRDSTNLANTKQSAQFRNLNSSNPISPNSINSSAIGEKKRLKVQFIQNNPNSQIANVSLQINPKTWPNLRVNDLIEIISQTGANIININSNIVNTTNLPNSSLNRGAVSSIVQLSSSNSSATSSINQNLPNTTNNEDDSSPYLLQVVQSSFNDSIPIDTIRIDQAANSPPFSIKNLTYVIVSIVDRSSVMLDLVEVTFKEQYLNGYDMLRIKKHVENTCVHIKKNIEFCSIRCSVRDLWATSGDVVTCGYIGEKTRLVFRSQSAMCLIYIQMSREMWEFDVNGEMYHEKAINFLGELFNNWKNQSCTHDVTITLFSRIYYDAKSIEEFPNSISKDIKTDHKKRFFEDFFRVVYQNERYEDWTPTLIILKRLIKEYRDYVLNYHRRQSGLNMPDAYLSPAAEGNFLETLNLSSSVFERHFIDRPFDRTGMMSLVITPGNGIYEVSRDLAKITKDRVIDNAIGSDLVCLGEQPMHSVPLFKYDTIDAFDIPNWINLSFYKSSEMVRYCNSSFLPSSKIKIKGQPKMILDSDAILPGYCHDKNLYLKSLEETDNMFENITNNKSTSETSNNSARKGTGNRLVQQISIQSQIDMSQNKPKSRRHNASTSSLSTSILNAEFQNNINKNKRSFDYNSQMNPAFYIDEHDDNDDSSFECDSDNEQNYFNPKDEDLTLSKKLKSKVNPFMPNSTKTRMSSQRRPWAHIFPLRSDGTPIFEHEHVKTNDACLDIGNNKSTTFPALINMNMNNNSLDQNCYNNNSIPRVSPDSNILGRNSIAIKDKISSFQNNLEITKSMKSRHPSTKMSLITKLIWETANIDETMATMKTGVAWKSLIIPASLPLTTDYLPSEKSWKNFVCSSSYSLLLDDIRDEYGYTNYVYNDNISMAEVFTELVGHRLAMGFQIVVPKNIYTYNNTLANPAESTTLTNNPGPKPIQFHTLSNTLPSNFICDLSSSFSFSRCQKDSIKSYYKVSLGRIYHELFYIVDKASRTEFVKVEIYVPKEINQLKQSKSFEYKYRFQVPDSKTYDISYCEMSRKNIEAIKWNYIDRYISIQGNGSLTPSELEKCWRQRLYLIPIMYVSNKTVCNDQIKSDSPNQVLSNSLNSLGFTNLTQSQIPASMIQNPYSTLKCDIYQRKSNEELKFIRDYYFIKFMEGLNKLNRADDKRCFSKSTLAYLDMFTSNSTNNTSCSLNSCPSTSNLQDLVVAVSAITSALTQINNSNSTILNLNKNQLVSFPTVSQKQQQIQNSQIKLTSPKKTLYPMVLKYLQTEAEHLKVDISNFLETEYKTHMLNNVYGVPYIQNKNDIPMNCFISAEAVWWCIDHISDVENEADAILIMQLMCDFNMIRHISNQQKLFVHGFYLYYVLTEESRNHHLYTKDYCEVGFVDIERGLSNDFTSGSDRFSLVSVKDLPPEASNTLPITTQEMFQSYISLFNLYSKTKFNNMTPDGILKLVNVDVDPGRKSNRVEWASAVYRSHYHQLCAFELEVQWEVATCSLLSETVNGWSKLSNRFNYHIVPAPIDPFAMPLVPNSDPLRGPIYIGLNLSCMIKNENVLFEDLIDEKYRFCLDELFSDKYSSPQNTFKFESSSASSQDSSASSSLSTTTTSNTLVNNAEATFRFLNENAPEFLRFLYKKHNDKKMVDKRIHEDSDFIRFEFLEFVEYERITRLIYFQEALLEKFGFIRNAAVIKTILNDDDPTFFIHASGGMFVYIPNYYFNYSNRSRHSSANTNLGAINDSNKSSNIILTKTNDVLKSELENSYSKRDRLTTQNSETSDDVIATNLKSINNIDNNTSKNTSGNSSTKTSLNNSYVSSSNISSNLINTNSSSNIVSRERSNTKSQHIQFLKLNEKNYSSNSGIGLVDNEKIAKTSESNEETDKLSDANDTDKVKEDLTNTKDEKNLEIKNDLLFKPKSSNSKFSCKNEKIDQIQHQHQREQMLLQTFVNSTKSPYQKYLSQKENRKIPFYADTEQFVGFFWSWNFMLGKKWRSQYTGDEQFQDNMLSDFRLFCSNQDGRLEKFFKESKTLLK